MVKKRYVYVDGLLRVGVRLHARGIPLSPHEIAEAGQALLARDQSVTAPAPVRARSLTAREEPTPTTPARRDILIEID